MSEDDVRVVLGASLQIPICVGSVALPLGYLDQLEVHAAAAEAEAAAVAARTQETMQEEAPTAARRKRARDEPESADGAAAAVQAPLSSSTTAASAPVRAGACSAPLSLRYTHRRYCYIRDGGEMANDAFCRWLHFQIGRGQRDGLAHASGATEPSATKRKKEKASPPSMTDTVLGTVSEQSEATLAAIARERSPSLFYSMVDRIEFVVPTSFPQPRRVVVRPPFVIEDLCWADHLVEVHVHFLPVLAIPPVVLLHQVILNHRVPDAPIPALLSATCEQPRVPPAAMDPYKPSLRPTHHDRGGVAEDENKGWSSREEAVWHLVQAAVVSERKDSIRLLNPTTAVAAYVRLVNAKMRDDVVLEPLRAFFLAHFDAGEAPTRHTTTTQPARAVAPVARAIRVELDNVPAYYTDLLVSDGAADHVHHDDPLTCLGEQGAPSSDARLAIRRGRGGDDGVGTGAHNDTGDDSEDEDEVIWPDASSAASPLRRYHHAWDLPFEAAIYIYASQRRDVESERTMKAVCEQLRREQEDLAGLIHTLVTARLPRAVARLHRQLEASYQRCLSLASVPLVSPDEDNPQPHLSPPQ